MLKAIIFVDESMDYDYQINSIRADVMFLWARVRAGLFPASASMAPVVESEICAEARLN